MHVIEVKSNKNLNDFISFQSTLYKDDPVWIQPLINEQKATLIKKTNPFWKHAEAAFFLVKINNKIVGRIGAIIDNLYLESHQDGAGYFGFFESINDQKVSDLLLNTARNWLKDRGIGIMRGPMNPCANDECGLLVEGFDTPPFIMMTHNPSYYKILFENYGLKKSMDWVAYLANAPKELPPIIINASNFAKKRIPSLKIRPINLKKPLEEGELLRDIYNSAWKDNWGFVPMTEEEMKHMVKRLKPLAISNLILIAEVNNKPAGVIALIPNYNEALKHLNGKLFPFGIFKLLYFANKIKSLRLIIMGVKAEFRKMGIEAALYLKAFENGIKLGYQQFESSMILESNTFVRKAAELVNSHAYKKYRIFDMKI